MCKFRILATAFAFNEGNKIRRAVARHPRERSYDLMVSDDGSTDGSVQALAGDEILVLRSERNQGIGAAMKRVFQYALDHDYDILVIQAGNDKDDPTQIPRLINPILRNDADFVQGSRFMPGGIYGNTPTYRVIATKYAHPLLFSAAVGKRLTETTNGFRAFRTSILRDNRINWRQKWLDHYELEPYLLYKTIKLGYRHQEVPVSKIYPSRAEGYTKMKPVTGWWSMLRPIVLLGFGFKS